jgi:hypothetical protein
MALVELKSNLANFRSSFTTKPLEDTVNRGSKLNIDSVPKTYNRRTAWTNAKVEKSELNRDSDSILKYSNRTKFLPVYIALSKLNIDSVPVKYSPGGKYTPSKYANEKAIPSTTTRWIGSTAPAVNYFDNKKSGASGFEIKATDKNKSGFTGVDNASNTYAYPTNVIGVHGSTVASLPLTNTKYPIDGVASLVSQLGNGSKFYYLSDNIRASKTFTEGGYYDKKKYSDTVKPNSSALGAKASESPSAIDSTLSNLPLLNAKYPIDGFASLTNQLGIGSKFYYISDNARVDKLFSLGGYNEKRKYSDLVKLNTSALKTKALDSKSSPSAIEEQYKKLNLRDDPHNIYNTYIQQPYVLRGIQREDKKEPQLWGIGRFDDGLIRGGITTAVERAALDTVRIAKWLASPKGLLWVVKQVGLGLTNPLVEADAISLAAGAGFRSNRVHTGIASLLSVPGSAFGLHFTRHGIPFANEAASYSSVSSRTNSILTYDFNNRLISLKKDLFGPLGGVSNFEGAPIFRLTGLAGPNSVYGIGTTTIRRSAITDSAAIARASDYGFTSIYNINSQYASAEFKSKSKPDTRIGPGFLLPAFSSKGEDGNKNTRDNVDVQDSSNTNERSSLFTLGTKLKDTDATPGTEIGIGNVQLDSNIRKSSAYPTTANNPINQYEVLAYNKIPKSKDIGRFNDFRVNLSDDSKAFSGKIIEANKSKLSYGDRNLEIQKGFGQQGKVGEDRSNPLEFLAPSKSDKKGQGFGRSRRALTSNSKFRGDKITALDVRAVKLTPEQVYPAEVDQIEFYFEDGTQGTNVMVFRCTMTGFSDSFSPGWSRIDIMGRPDGAYLYTSFERQISFTFTAAATSKSEMIPMWRKLNYLASYTMPDFRAGGKPAGPFMRLTIGNLFKNTPGFLNSLSYTIPDEATWDVDANNRSGEAKQLPNIVEVSVGFTVIGDFRPQVKGRAYSLFADNTGGQHDWLWDSGVNATKAKENEEQYKKDKDALKEQSKKDNTPTEATAPAPDPGAPTPAPAPTETNYGDEEPKTETDVKEDTADETPEVK